MPLSVHYYVLSLGASTNVLFEAFRDCLIDIEDQGFPIATPSGLPGSVDPEKLRELARTVDTCLGHAYMLDPLKLVVVGEKAMQSAFGAVTAYGTAVIGRVESDHTATSPRDLGLIVWMVVKEAMSGVLDRAIRDFETSRTKGLAASGLEAVARLASEGVRGTLLVEEGYHVRGSLGDRDGSRIVSPDVDVRDSLDDAVDAVVEKVLAARGNVVFTPAGALGARNQIALLVRDGATP